MKAPTLLLSIVLCCVALSQASHSFTFSFNTAAPSVDAETSLYLPVEQTHGGRWCLDPDSQRVRQILLAPSDPLPAVLNGADLAKDLVDLQELLRTQYPGYAVLSQKPGFDVNQFFNNWRERLRGKISVPFSDEVIAPLRELRDMIVDQHLAVWGTEGELKKNSLMDVREFQTVISEAPPDLKACNVDGARRVYESTLRVSRLLSSSGLQRLVTVTAAADGPLTLRCAGKKWKLTERPLYPMPMPGGAESFYHWSVVDDTAVIRIRRLYGSTKDLENLSQIDKDFPEHSKFQRVIFDLRANGGGDDSYVYNWISQAKSGIWSSGAEVRRIGDLFPCGDWNMTVIRRVRDHTIDSEAARADREKLRSAWPSRAPDSREIFDDGLITDTSPHPYHGRVYVLIDRQAASAGEGATLALRNALGAVVLGERSGGVITFTNERTIILPRTGIRFNVPTKRNWFNEPIEVVGVPVDVYLENSAIAVQDLLPMLDRLDEELPPLGTK